MAIKMMDIEAAQIAMDNLQIGENVEYTINGITHNRKLLEKSAYGITVQGPTNKLTLPVELTTKYKEYEMARSPLPPNGPPARRGRPPKGQNVAPVNMPTPPAYLPPGSAYAGPVQSAPGQFQAAPDQPQRQDQPTPTLSEVAAKITEAFIPIQAAEGSSDWAIEAFDEALGIFRESIATILENCINQDDATEAANAPEPHLKTCYDCVNVDMDAGICGMFKVAPPMKVQCDAKTNCDQFVDCEEIPY